MRKLCSLILAILLTTVLCSCSFDESENSFRGGELLDDNKMSEIKESFFTEESEKSEETEGDDKKETPKETQKETESRRDDETEYQSECETSKTEEEIATSAVEENGTVYWTKGGSVWHTSKDCYYIKKSNNVESGSVEDAKEAGKEKICSHCGK